MIDGGKKRPPLFSDSSSAIPDLDDEMQRKYRQLLFSRIKEILFSCRSFDVCESSVSWRWNGLESQGSENPNLLSPKPYFSPVFEAVNKLKVSEREKVLDFLIGCMCTMSQWFFSSLKAVPGLDKASLKEILPPHHDLILADHVRTAWSDHCEGLRELEGISALLEFFQVPFLLVKFMEEMSVFEKESNSLVFICQVRLMRSFIGDLGSIKSSIASHINHLPCFGSPSRSNECTSFDEFKFYKSKDFTIFDDEFCLNSFQYLDVFEKLLLQNLPLESTYCSLVVGEFDSSGNGVFSDSILFSSYAAETLNSEGELSKETNPARRRKLNEQPLKLSDMVSAFFSITEKNQIILTPMGLCLYGWYRSIHFDKSRRPPACFPVAEVLFLVNALKVNISSQTFIFDGEIIEKSNPSSPHDSDGETSEICNRVPHSSVASGLPVSEKSGHISRKSSVSIVQNLDLLSQTVYILESYILSKDDISKELERLSWLLGSKEMRVFGPSPFPPHTFPIPSPEISYVFQSCRQFSSQILSKMNQLKDIGSNIADELKRQWETSRFRVSDSFPLLRDNPEIFSSLDGARHANNELLNEIDEFKNDPIVRTLMGLGRLSQDSLPALSESLFQLSSEKGFEDPTAPSPVALISPLIVQGIEKRLYSVLNVSLGVDVLSTSIRNSVMMRDSLSNKGVSKNYRRDRSKQILSNPKINHRTEKMNEELGVRLLSPHAFSSESRFNMLADIYCPLLLEGIYNFEAPDLRALIKESLRRALIVHNSELESTHSVSKAVESIFLPSEVIPDDHILGLFDTKTSGIGCLIEKVRHALRADMITKKIIDFVMPESPDNSMQQSTFFTVDTLKGILVDLCDVESPFFESPSFLNLYESLNYSISSSLEWRSNPHSASVLEQKIKLYEKSPDSKHIDTSMLNYTSWNDEMRRSLLQTGSMRIDHSSELDLKSPVEVNIITDKFIVLKAFSALSTSHNSRNWNSPPISSVGGRMYNAAAGFTYKDDEDMGSNVQSDTNRHQDQTVLPDFIGNFVHSGHNYKDLYSSFRQFCDQGANHPFLSNAIQRTTLYSSLFFHVLLIAIAATDFSESKMGVSTDIGREDDVTGIHRNHASFSHAETFTDTIVHRTKRSHAKLIGILYYLVKSLGCAEGETFAHWLLSSSITSFSYCRTMFDLNIPVSLNENSQGIGSSSYNYSQNIVPNGHDSNGTRKSCVEVSLMEVLVNYIQSQIKGNRFQLNIYADSTVSTSYETQAERRSKDSHQLVSTSKSADIERAIYSLSSFALYGTLSSLRVLSDSRKKEALHLRSISELSNLLRVLSVGVHADSMLALLSRLYRPLLRSIIVFYSQLPLAKKDPIRAQLSKILSDPYLLELCEDFYKGKEYSVGSLSEYSRQAFLFIFGSLINVWKTCAQRLHDSLILLSTDPSSLHSNQVTRTCQATEKRRFAIPLKRDDFQNFLSVHTLVSFLLTGRIQSVISENLVFRQLVALGEGNGMDLQRIPFSSVREISTRTSLPPVFQLLSILTILPTANIVEEREETFRKVEDVLRRNMDSRLCRTFILLLRRFVLGGESMSESREVGYDPNSVSHPTFTEVQAISDDMSDMDMDVLHTPNRPVSEQTDETDMCSLSSSFGDVAMTTTLNSDSTRTRSDSPDQSSKALVPKCVDTPHGIPQNLFTPLTVPAVLNDLLTIPAVQNRIDRDRIEERKLFNLSNPQKELPLIAIGMLEAFEHSQRISSDTKKNLSGSSILASFSLSSSIVPFDENSSNPIIYSDYDVLTLSDRVFFGYEQLEASIVSSLPLSESTVFLDEGIFDPSLVLRKGLEFTDDGLIREVLRDLTRPSITEQHRTRLHQLLCVVLLEEAETRSNTLLLDPYHSPERTCVSDLTDAIENLDISTDSALANNNSNISENYSTERPSFGTMSSSSVNDMDIDDDPREDEPTNLSPILAPGAGPSHRSVSIGNSSTILPGSRLDTSSLMRIATYALESLSSLVHRRGVKQLAVFDSLLEVLNRTVRLLPPSQCFFESKHVSLHLLELMTLVYGIGVSPPVDFANDPQFPSQGLPLSGSAQSYVDDRWLDSIADVLRALSGLSMGWATAIDETLRAVMLLLTAVGEGSSLSTYSLGMCTNVMRVLVPLSVAPKPGGACIVCDPSLQSKKYNGTISRVDITAREVEVLTNGRGNIAHVRTIHCSFDHVEALPKTCHRPLLVLHDLQLIEAAAIGFTQVLSSSDHRALVAKADFDRFCVHFLNGVIATFAGAEAVSHREPIPEKLDDLRYMFQGGVNDIVEDLYFTCKEFQLRSKSESITVPSLPLQADIRCLRLALGALMHRSLRAENAEKSEIAFWKWIFEDGMEAHASLYPLRTFLACAHSQMLYSFSPLQCHQASENDVVFDPSLSKNKELSNFNDFQRLFNTASTPRNPGSTPMDDRIPFYVSLPNLSGYEKSIVDSSDFLFPLPSVKSIDWRFSSAFPLKPSQESQLQLDPDIQVLLELFVVASKLEVPHISIPEPVEESSEHAVVDQSNSDRPPDASVAEWESVAQIYETLAQMHTKQAILACLKRHNGNRDETAMYLMEHPPAPTFSSSSRSSHFQAATEASSSGNGQQVDEYPVRKPPVYLVTSLLEDLNFMRAGPSLGRFASDSPLLFDISGKSTVFIEDLSRTLALQMFAPRYDISNATPFSAQLSDDAMILSTVSSVPAGIDPTPLRLADLNTPSADSSVRSSASATTVGAEGAVSSAAAGSGEMPNGLIVSQRGDMDDVYTTYGQGMRPFVRTSQLLQGRFLKEVMSLLGQDAQFFQSDAPSQVADLVVNNEVSAGADMLLLPDSAHNLTVDTQSNPEDRKRMRTSQRVFTLLSGLFPLTQTSGDSRGGTSTPRAVPGTGELFLDFPLAAYFVLDGSLARKLGFLLDFQNQFVRDKMLDELAELLYVSKPVKPDASGDSMAVSETLDEKARALKEDVNARLKLVLSSPISAHNLSNPLTPPQSCSLRNMTSVKLRPLLGTERFVQTFYMPRADPFQLLANIYPEENDTLDSFVDILLELAIQQQRPVEMSYAEMKAAATPCIVLAYGIEKVQIPEAVATWASWLESCGKPNKDANANANIYPAWAMKAPISFNDSNVIVDVPVAMVSFTEANGNVRIKKVMKHDLFVCSDFLGVSLKCSGSESANRLAKALFERSSIGTSMLSRDLLAKSILKLPSKLLVDVIPSSNTTNTRVNSPSSAISLSMLMPNLESCLSPRNLILLVNALEQQSSTVAGLYGALSRNATAVSSNLRLQFEDMMGTGIFSPIDRPYLFQRASSLTARQARASSLQLLHRLLALRMPSVDVAAAHAASLSLRISAALTSTLFSSNFYMPLDIPILPSRLREDAALVETLNKRAFAVARKGLRRRRYAVLVMDAFMDLRRNVTRSIHAEGPVPPLGSVAETEAARFEGTQGYCTVLEFRNVEGLQEIPSTNLPGNADDLPHFELYVLPDAVGSAVSGGFTCVDTSIIHHLPLGAVLVSRFQVPPSSPIVVQGRRVALVRCYGVKLTPSNLVSNRTADPESERLAISALKEHLAFPSFAGVQGMFAVRVTRLPLSSAALAVQTFAAMLNRSKSSHPAVQDHSDMSDDNTLSLKEALSVDKEAISALLMYLLSSAPWLKRQIPPLLMELMASVSSMITPRLCANSSSSILSIGSVLDSLIEEYSIDATTLPIRRASEEASVSAFLPSLLSAISKAPVPILLVLHSFLESRVLNPEDDEGVHLAASSTPIGCETRRSRTLLRSTTDPQYCQLLEVTSSALASLDALRALTVVLPASISPSYPVVLRRDMLSPLPAFISIENRTASSMNVTGSPYCESLHLRVYDETSRNPQEMVDAILKANSANTSQRASTANRQSAVSRQDGMTIVGSIPISSSVCVFHNFIALELGTPTVALRLVRAIAVSIITGALLPNIIAAVMYHRVYAPPPGPDVSLPNRHGVMEITPREMLEVHLSMSRFIVTPQELLPLSERINSVDSDILKFLRVLMERHNIRRIMDIPQAKLQLVDRDVQNFRHLAASTSPIGQELASDIKLRIALFAIFDELLSVVNGYASLVQWGLHCASTESQQCAQSSLLTALKNSDSGISSDQFPVPLFDFDNVISGRNELLSASFKPDLMHSQLQLGVVSGSRLIPSAISLLFRPSKGIVDPSVSCIYGALSGDAVSVPLQFASHAELNHSELSSFVQEICSLPLASLIRESYLLRELSLFAAEVLLIKSLNFTKADVPVPKIQLDNRVAMHSVENKLLLPSKSHSTFVQFVKFISNLKMPDKTLRKSLSERQTLFEVNYIGVMGVAEEGLDWGGVYRETLSRIIEDLFSERKGVDIFTPVDIDFDNIGSSASRINSDEGNLPSSFVLPNGVRISAQQIIDELGLRDIDLGHIPNFMYSPFHTMDAPSTGLIREEIDRLNSVNFNIFSEFLKKEESVQFPLVNPLTEKVGPRSTNVTRKLRSFSNLGTTLSSKAHSLLSDLFVDFNTLLLHVQGEKRAKKPDDRSLLQSIKENKEICSQLQHLCGHSNITFENYTELNIIRAKSLQSPSQDVITNADISMASALYQWLGRLMGVSLRTESGDLAISFSPLVWKILAGDSICSADIAYVDPLLSTFLIALESFKASDDAKTEEQIEEEFESIFGSLHFVLPKCKFVKMTRCSAATDQTLSNNSVALNGLGKPRFEESDIPLLPGGNCRKVSYRNRFNYVQSVVMRILEPLRHGIGCVSQGMRTIVPPQTLDALSWRNLKLLVSSDDKIDLAVLREHTKYDANNHYSENSRVIEFFWRALAELTQQELKNFVRFAWGRSSLPRGEWPKQNNGSTLKFTIVPRKGHVAGLPLSHTCFFLIELPEYQTYEDLKKNLMLAIEFGAGEAFLIS